jgi:hypothetical protein
LEWPRKSTEKKEFKEFKEFQEFKEESLAELIG